MKIQLPSTNWQTLSRQRPHHDTGRSCLLSEKYKRYQTPYVQWKNFHFQFQMPNISVGKVSLTGKCEQSNALCIQSQQSITSIKHNSCHQVAHTEILDAPTSTIDQQSIDHRAAQTVTLLIQPEHSSREGVLPYTRYFSLNSFRTKASTVLLKSRALTRSLDAQVIILCTGIDVYFLGYWKFSTHHFCDSFKLLHNISLSWCSRHKLSIILLCLLPHVCTHISKPVFKLATNATQITSMTSHDNTFPSRTASPPPSTTQHYPLIPIIVGGNTVYTFIYWPHCADCLLASLVSLPPTALLFVALLLIS